MNHSHITLSPIQKANAPLLMLAQFLPGVGQVQQHQMVLSLEELVLLAPTGIFALAQQVITEKNMT